MFVCFSHILCCDIGVVCKLNQLVLKSYLKNSDITALQPLQVKTCCCSLFCDSKLNIFMFEDVTLGFRKIWWPFSPFCLFSQTLIGAIFSFFSEHAT